MSWRIKFVFISICYSTLLFLLQQLLILLNVYYNHCNISYVCVSIRSVYCNLIPETLVHTMFMIPSISKFQMYPSHSGNHVSFLL